MARDFLTLDIDWSPDWMIEDVMATLERHKVRSTWFVTHDSPAIAALRGHPLVERGIHPNFLDGSSHGRSEAEVFGFVRGIVPEAVSMRTHGLFQSTGLLLRAAGQHGIRLDSSLFVPPDADGGPHDILVDDIVLRRVPYCWADDMTIRHPQPNWSSVPGNGAGTIRVFDFHPFHLMLNTVDYKLYEKLKGLRPLREWDRAFVASHRSQGGGPATFFSMLVETMSPGGFLRELL